LLGTKQEVLVEEENLGRTRGNYRVILAGNVRPGETVDVRITDSSRPTLEGTVE